MSRFYNITIVENKSGRKKYLIEDSFGNNLSEIGFLIGNDFTPCSGAVGLLKSDDHDEYCQLYYAYRKKDYDDNTVRIDFTPVNDRNGNEIFIKHETECPFCSFDTEIKFDEEYNATKTGYLVFYY